MADAVVEGASGQTFVCPLETVTDDSTGGGPEGAAPCQEVDGWVTAEALAALLGTPEGRAASRKASPHFDLGAWLQAFHEELEAKERWRDLLDAELRKLGLDRTQVLDLQTTVTVAQQGAGDTKDDGEQLRKTTKSVVVALASHGLTDKQVATILALAETDVQGYIEDRESNGALRRVVELHHNGRTALQISKETEISVGRVYQILSSVGLKANTERVRVPDYLRARVVALKSEGKSVKFIQDTTGLSRDQVNNCIRRATKAGEL